MKWKFSPTSNLLNSKSLQPHGKTFNNYLITKLNILKVYKNLIAKI